MNDDVRALGAAGFAVFKIKTRALQSVVIWFLQSGILENAFERNLSPVALRLHIALQGLGQTFGLEFHFFIREYDVLYFFLERELLFSLLAERVIHFFLELLNALT